MGATDRFEGHIVQGHIDDTAEVTKVVPEGDGRRMTIRVPKRLRRYLVEKGSLTVDGVSLTVAALRRKTAEVVLIPHTLAMTNLGLRATGDRVNLEVDLMAKYIERLLAGRK